jgi:phosphoribosylanthranilate isomerase
VHLTGVGVFVNAPPELIATVLDSCGLDLAQLSGDEPAEHIHSLAPRAYKALRPTNLLTAQEQAGQMARLAAPALLVDAFRPGEYGGTGLTGDWPIARALATSYPLLLAGGLTPENVSRAVIEVQPWGVDVASGVESAPGIKDTSRMQAFIQAVRRSTKEMMP